MTTKLPAPNKGRVETGTVQFGDDWPGVFIRGDNAMYYGMCLDVVLQEVEAGREPPAIELLNLRSLARILAGCQAPLKLDDPGA